MPGEKKPPKRSAKRRPSPAQAAAKKDRTRKSAPAKPPEKKPGARRLTNAQAYQRDTLMIARLAEDWPWEKVAKEAGLTVAGAKKAVAKRQEEAIPLRLTADPVVIIERIFEALQLSVGSFEAIAMEALEKGQLSNAVGAKKAALESHEKTLMLLQLTGRMPQDLSTLRHLIDLRAIAVRILDSLDAFEREMHVVLRLSDDEERVEAGRAAAEKIRTTFNDLIGIEGDAPAVPELVEGRVVE